MPHVVILAASLGGIVMAYEVKEKMRPQNKLTGDGHSRKSDPGLEPTMLPEHTSRRKVERA